RAIRKELGETSETESDEFRQRLAEKQMPDNVREKLEREIIRYADLPAGSHEAPSARNYIECMLDLPWSETSEDCLDLDHAREVLEADHYGMEKVKKRIIEYLAVAKLTGKVNGQVICFAGPPGVGKTSIVKSIADALGRKFVRMSLGGIRDEAEIRGHRRTYIGAMPGRVIAAMRQAGTMNPVILFDEIDKLAGDYHGDPAAAMLEVLDSAQNFAFRDHFLEMPYDLSKVMFLTTANDKGNIPAPLLDRMEIIDVPGYLETEKAEIAKRHLLPRQLEKHGLKKSMLTIPDAMYPAIIRGYTAESGVRELERVLAGICRRAACDIGDGSAKRIRLNPQRMKEYLGQPRFEDLAKDHKDAVGVVNGLAWTSVGGDTLEIEVQTVNGSGQILLTGKLGDVMQESAKAALTFVHANAEMLGIDEKLFKEKDIHLHVPEGAVPKDGPSAGITMATAIASALTGIPVKGNVAMTGEITLRGRVLPIGGLREKLLAAVRSGITTVLIPAQNKKDLEEVPEEIKGALKIMCVSDAMEVLDQALTSMPEANHHHIHISHGKSGSVPMQ
ncbi:MAG: endopeptidase La, partial [Clostridia bacterium]|nr:endopeptidase La [Clostridia bacterium]